MGLKFDSVISRDFSAMRPQALIRSGNCNSPGNTTALPRFQFHKRSQLFVATNDKPLPIIAMRVSNPDGSPVGINRGDAAPTETGSDIILPFGSWTIALLWIALLAGFGVSLLPGISMAGHLGGLICGAFVAPFARFRTK
jgi:membrane associated rhomboid family serine protease